MKYGANVWFRMYSRFGDPKFPMPPMCDLYANVPECAKDARASRWRERVRSRRRGWRAVPRAAANASVRAMMLAGPGYTCARHRDYRAACIRGGGVGCPFRQVSSLAQCRALCDEYPGQCFTLVHNRYGECYLRTEHAGAGAPDERRHRTVSCRRHASW